MKTILNQSILTTLTADCYIEWTKRASENQELVQVPMRGDQRGPPRVRAFIHGSLLAIIK